MTTSRYFSSKKIKFIFQIRDGFYLQVFEAVFPEIDLSVLKQGESEEEMAQNIQTLINILDDNLEQYDLKQISGNEIVNGNPIHCLNLLHTIKTIIIELLKEEGEMDEDEMQGED